MLFFCTEEAINDADDHSLMPTPPQTPLITNSLSPVHLQFATPDQSVGEDEQQVARSPARTPQVSDAMHSFRSLQEFERSELNLIEASEKFIFQRGQLFL